MTNIGRFKSQTGLDFETITDDYIKSSGKQYDHEDLEMIACLLNLLHDPRVRVFLSVRNLIFSLN